MNIIEKPAYQCGVCKKAYFDKDIAEKCCVPRLCEDCGKEIESYRIVCEPCYEKRQFDKAEKLTYAQWDGWVQRDGYGYNEGYFESVDDLLQHCEDEDIEPPDWVFCCESREHKLNADDILDNMLSDAHEDARDCIVDEEELCRFVKEWNAKQTVATYYPDYSKVVILK